MKQNINKDLKIFLWFSDEFTPLTLKINLRIILGSKSENLRILRPSKKLGILIKKLHICVQISMLFPFEVRRDFFKNK